MQMQDQRAALDDHFEQKTIAAANKVWTRGGV
jgi:hypothetical protein